MTCSSMPPRDFLLRSTLLSSISLHQWGYGRVEAYTSEIFPVLSASPALLLLLFVPCLAPRAVLVGTGST